MALLIPEGDTLVTYYILPLLGLNKKSFGNRFRTSLLDFNGRVYVRLSKPMEIPTYKDNPNFTSEIIIAGEFYITFTIPDEFYEEFTLFLAGTYSKYKKEAKEIIYKTSTLHYNKPIGKFILSHPILQALDRTKTLREFLKKYFQVEELAESGELIDKPQKEWFIEYFIDLEKQKQL
jgi:hypothetical protein